MANYNLYNDDCMNVFPLLEDSSIQCIITDLPYDGVSKKGEERAKYGGQLRKIDKGKADIITFDLDEFLQECVRVSDGSIYLFCGIGQISQIYNFFEQKHIQKDYMVRLCVWHKSNPSPMNGQHMYLNATEYLVYAKKRKTTFNRKCIHNVINFPTGRSKIHPTEKPVRLLQQLILDSTNEGDTVADFCGGSFSTGVAALELQRNFIGVELDKTYFDSAKQRIESAYSGGDGSEVYGE